VETDGGQATVAGGRDRWDLVRTPVARPGLTGKRDVQIQRNACASGCYRDDGGVGQETALTSLTRMEVPL
jgi:hypothetical protein